MVIKDKINILENIKYSNKVVIELGPGKEKIYKDAIGIDIVDSDEVDIVADLNNGLPFLSDNSVDEIYSNHFLEHVNNIGDFFSEIHRVLKKGGRIISTVPHFSNPCFYSDYTHKNYWGIYTLSYFSKSKYYSREIPTFYNSIDFKIENIEIQFKSFGVISEVINKIAFKIFNSSKKNQEIYELHFCYILPAWAIKFEIIKV